ncbi:carbohydrate kinase family protein [Phytoactinopolyspora limicola]|uniref:carbohydrate kinase family protein n=1 Tax=Phytoactinopolyspora limicola TaxID=2715536 RepID=UPI0031B5E19B
MAGDPAPGSDTPATIRVAGGGQAANTAAWLAAEGVEVTLVGAVGDDQPGQARLAELQAAGVRTDVTVCPDRATGSVIVLAHSADRTMISDRGANRGLEASRVVAAVKASRSRHLHLSGYVLLDLESRPAGLAALASARAGGLTTSVDASSAIPLREVAAEFLEWVAGVDVLFANAAEADVLAGPGDPVEQATRLAGRVGGSVVVKLGAGGAVWAGDDGVRREPGRVVDVVDTTGAGDAFAAGVLRAWCAGDGVAAALRAGCDLGARAVGMVGARLAR